MDFLYNVLWGEGTEQAVIALSLAIIIGLALGNVSFLGIRLGVGGVLFSSLLFGYLGIAPKDHVIIGFLKDFGLIIFVFTIGLQVGPNFTKSLKKSGLSYTIIGAFAVFLSVLVTLGAAAFFKLPPDVSAGLFSGGVTSTPTLAAVSQSLRDLLDPSLSASAVEAAGLGYAIAYPFGIIGVIILMIIVRSFFTTKKAALTPVKENAEEQKIHSLSLSVQNPLLDGLSIQKLKSLLPQDCLITRFEKEGKMHFACPDNIVHLQNHLHIVCYAQEIEKIKALIGSEDAADLRLLEGGVASRTVFVTQPSAVGKSLQALDITASHGLVVSRIERADSEFLPQENSPLLFGDKLTLVGEPLALDNGDRILGNAPKQMEVPHVLPLFAGILLGILLGSIPISIPGLSASFKLGMTGGPMIMAIFLSRVPKLAGINWFMPTSANLMLKELGIALFLACVGLSSGESFVVALADGTGFYWMFIAMGITLLPLIGVILVARLFFKYECETICGLLAGSMTGTPALAFSVEMLQTNAPASVYATIYPTVMIMRILAGQLLVAALYAL